MPEPAVQPPTPPSLAREARRRLLSTGDLPPELVNPDLARSWMRSLGAGLHPSGRMPGAPHASGPQLARALERQHELVSHARPVMEFMFDQTRCLDSMVILAGADGMLLHAFGDPQFVGRAERVALRPGANWAEQYRGTNAVGTALAEDRAVVIHGGEHYLERNGFLTCTAAPIHDPGGRLLGVLDVSGDHRSYHPQMLGAVRSAARMIETRLFESRHDPHLWGGMRLRFHVQPEGIFTVAEGLLAVREDGLVVGANQTALELLGLRWADLGQIGIDEVLIESVAQLLEWCHRGSPVARVVHTQAERALWMRAEMSRSAPVLMLPQVVASPAIDRSQPDDALAALDTGDAAMTTAITRARKVMGKSIALLLQGESGVGKEVFSRAMHKSSLRRDGPFVSVNCAALPENLIETELFGYQAGAFTGARRDGATGRVREAHGGTLFLDEIGDMPLMLQARLLQVLQDRQVVPIGGGKPVPVDFSLICATHRNIPAEIEAGRFREDLYYRINGFMLLLPPLRERSDLSGLIASELHKLMPAHPPTVDPALLPDLLRYRWPGNVRQLFNALRTACAMLDDHETVISWQHLPDDLVQALRAAPAPAASVVPADTAAVAADGAPAAAPTNLRSVSRQLIERTLADCGGNVSEAGRRLGISRNTLYRRLRDAG